MSGIDDVAAALATNPQIEILRMAENELNDRDAELIAHALKHNTNLHKLYLEENNITATGFEKIRTTIYDPSSFNAMEAGNHTCYCMGNEGNNTHGLTPQQRRRRKFPQNPKRVLQPSR